MAAGRGGRRSRAREPLEKNGYKVPLLKGVVDRGAAGDRVAAASQGQELQAGSRVTRRLQSDGRLVDDSSILPERLRVRFRSIVPSATAWARRPGERVLVVTDEPLRPIGYRAPARRRATLGLDVLLVDMLPRKSNGEEPPPEVADLMTRFDVVLCPTSKSLTHTDSRRAASAEGRPRGHAARRDRGDHGPLHERGLPRDRRAHLPAVRAAREDEAPCASRRRPAPTSRCRSRGARRTPVPACSARRGSGATCRPARRTSRRSRGGRTASWSSTARWPAWAWCASRSASWSRTATRPTSPAARRRRSSIALLEPHGKDARTVAEFGIGTNDKAILTGIILEDEKVMGTIHIAFGDNKSMGGTVRVASHLDGLVKQPTVWFDDAEGHGGRPAARGGLSENHRRWNVPRTHPTRPAERTSEQARGGLPVPHGRQRRSSGGRRRGLTPTPA